MTSGAIQQDVICSHAAYLFHDLGGHPAGRAHEGVPRLGPGEVAPRRQPRRHAKVRNLDLAVCAQEDVAGLQQSSWLNRLTNDGVTAATALGNGER
jgi:hypothetical protein